MSCKICCSTIDATLDFGYQQQKRGIAKVILKKRKHGTVCTIDPKTEKGNRELREMRGRIVENCGEPPTDIPPISFIILMPGN